MLQCPTTLPPSRYCNQLVKTQQTNLERTPSVEEWAFDDLFWTFRQMGVQLKFNHN